MLSTAFALALVKHSKWAAGIQLCAHSACREERRDWVSDGVKLDSATVCSPPPTDVLQRSGRKGKMCPCTVNAQN